MSEALRRQAHAVIAEELDAERDAEGRIHLTETHVRFGAAALGAAAAGLTALQLGAVGYAVAQQDPGAGSIGTEANPLQEIYADTIDRQTDEIRTDTLSIAGNEFVLDADATVANEASNVRVRSDAIEIADGATWNPAMAEWYDGSTWGGAVVERYNGGAWTQIYPENTIPGSAVLRWPASSGSGTSVEETVDTYSGQDGTLSSDTMWSSGTYVDGWALAGDGSNSMLTGDWGSFGSQMDSGFWVALTIDDLTASDGYALGVNATGSSGFMQFEIKLGDPFDNFGSGLPGLTIADANDNLDQAYADDTVNDGSKHRLVIQNPGLAASDAEFYIDAVQSTTNVERSNGASTSENFTDGVRFHARTSGGWADRQTAVTIDDPIAGLGTLSSSEIQSDYDRQPWS